MAYIYGVYKFEIDINRSILMLINLVAIVILQQSSSDNQNNTECTAKVSKVATDENSIPLFFLKMSS